MSGLKWRKGGALGIVGESGSGKSITSLALLGMVPKPGAIGGGIFFEAGTWLASLGEKEFRAIRGSKQFMISQDPMTSLNPFSAVWLQIAEVTREHLGHGRAQAWDYALDGLDSPDNDVLGFRDFSDGVTGKRSVYLVAGVSNLLSL